MPGRVSAICIHPRSVLSVNIDPITTAEQKHQHLTLSPLWTKQAAVQTRSIYVQASMSKPGAKFARQFGSVFTAVSLAHLAGIL